MPPASCPFCCSRKVSVSETNVRATRTLTTYRCDDCLKAWTEEVISEQPALFSPP